MRNNYLMYILTKEVEIQFWEHIPRVSLPENFEKILTINE